MSSHHETVLTGTYADGAYENHVMPFFWMKGEDHATIAEYLEHIAAADIHEICVESRPHPDFCGPRWWDDLGFVIQECKRWDMGVWILDDSHFPTGFANGQIKAAHPELRKTVLTHRTFDVMGPRFGVSMVLTNPVDPEEVFCGLVALHDGKARELAYRQVGERVFFDIEDAGATRVLALFTARHSGHNDDYINMVDKASCDVLIEAVYEPHYEHFGAEFGHTIRGFFTDEPGFMNEKGAKTGTETDSRIGKPDMPLPWSTELERRLRARWGARFMANLALLWESGAGAPQVRHAYMDEVTKLYRECFDENIGSWCRAHGVMHIGHVIEDRDCHARLGVGAGHFFRALGGQDMAGVDIVINQLVPGIDCGEHSYGRGRWDMEFFTYALAKLGSSAAHLDPKKAGRCMAEVFGAFGWHEGLKEMTWIANHFLVRGVNWFVPHAFSMAPFPDPDCPPHFYAHGENPQFRYFGKLMTYLNRMGTLLSGGVAHPVAAVLYHADAEWAGDAVPVQRIASALARAQVDFDFVPADVFSDAERYELVVDANGQGFAINGQRYRCLVVPGAEYAGRATAAGVLQLQAAGIPVFVVGDVPRGCYDDDGVADAGSDAEGAVEGAAAVRDAFARVKRVDGATLADAIAAHGLADVQLADVQPWLRSYHYTNESEEYYFFVNESPVQKLCTQVMSADGSLLTGVAYDVLNGGSTAFDGMLRLAPYEALLVVADGEAPERGASLLAAEMDGVFDEALGFVPENACAAMRLERPWSVSYAAARTYPAFSDAHELTELVNLSEQVYPDTCGTYRYVTSFELETPQAVLLDLGDVFEIAAVLVDGRERGERIAPPYRFDLGQLAAGQHELVVEVTNTLDHAVTDMFALSEPSEPTGLIGPVRLIVRA